MFNAHQKIQCIASLFVSCVMVMSLHCQATPSMVAQTPHGKSNMMTVSPDGALWAVAGDNAVKLWDARGRLLRTFAPFKGDAETVAFSPDGKLIAAADNKRALKVFALDGTLVREIPLDYGSHGLAFSNDGKHLYVTATQNESSTFTSLFVADGNIEWRKEQKSNRGLNIPVISDFANPSVSPDGKEIAVGVRRDLRDKGRSALFFTAALQVWSSEGTLLREHVLPFEKYQREFAPSPSQLRWNEDGSITGFVGKGFVHWNHALTSATGLGAESGQAGSLGLRGELIWIAKEQAQGVAEGKGNKKQRNTNAPTTDVLVLSQQGVEKKLNLNRATGAPKINGAGTTMLSDRRIMVMLRTDGSTSDYAAEFWIVDADLKSARPLGEPMSGVVRVEVSPDGQFFATGLANGSVDLWSRDGRRIRRLSLPMLTSAESSYGTTGVSALSFSQDGSLLVAGNSQGIRVWNRNGSLVRELLGEKGNMTDIFVDEGGKKIVIDYGQYGGREVVAIGADSKKLFTHPLEPPYVVELVVGQGVRLYENPFKKKKDGSYGYVESHIDVAWDGTETSAMQPAKRAWVKDRPPVPLPNWTEEGVPIGAGYTLKGSFNSPELIIKSATQLPVHLVASATDWLVWSDDGVFDGSPGSTRLLLQVEGLTPYAIDQFALRDNRPDLLLARLGVADTAAQQYYKTLWQRRLVKAGITESQLQAGLRVPTVQIQSAKREGDILVVQAKVAAAGAPLARYNVFVNGVPIFGAASKPLSGNEALIEERVALVPGSNQVEISALDQAGAESFRALHTEVMAGTRKGDLWVMAFGVSRYEDPALQLEWANKDALDLSSVLKRLEGKGFNKVNTKVLTDAQVTPAALRSAKAFLATAKPEDTLVVFIAGHGVHDRDAAATYYFLPVGTKVDDIAGSAVTFETIEDLLQGVGPRQKLFLMDTCESGEADEGAAPSLMPDAKSRGLAARALKRVGGNEAVSVAPPSRVYLRQRDRFIYNDLSRRSGAIVFSSSRGGEYSYERSDIKHGVFTFAVLEALQKSSADSNADGQLSTDELRNFVAKKVANETNDKQNPTVDRDNAYARFGFQLIGK